MESWELRELKNKIDNKAENWKVRDLESQVSSLKHRCNDLEDTISDVYRFAGALKERLEYLETKDVQLTESESDDQG